MLWRNKNREKRIGNAVGKRENVILDRVRKGLPSWLALKQSPERGNRVAHGLWGCGKGTQAGHSKCNGPEAAVMGLIRAVRRPVWLRPWEQGQQQALRSRDSWGQISQGHEGHSKSFGFYFKELGSHEESWVACKKYQTHVKVGKVRWCIYILWISQLLTFCHVCFICFGF